ncbi:MAG: carbohydrate-binding protein [Bacillota bacterium]
MSAAGLAKLCAELRMHRKSSRTDPAVSALIAPVLEPLELRMLLSVAKVTPALNTGEVDRSRHSSVVAYAVSRAGARPSPEQYAFRSKPVRIPGTLQAERFDGGGEGVAYHDSTPRNTSRLYRPDEAVDIAATGDGGFCVTATKPGEWLEYQVYVSSTARYDLAVRVASLGPGGSFHLSIDGTHRFRSVSVPSSGGWQNWTTITQKGISLTAGKHVLRLNMDTAGARGVIGAFDWLKFTPSVPNAPTQLTATVSSAWQINLTWVDQARDESGFVIERRTGSASNWTRVATVGSNVTTYRDTRVEANTEYSYRVKAITTLSESVYTDPTAAMTPYAGPITITAGGTYTGSWESLDPNVPAVQIETSEPVIIQNSSIRSRGDLIKATGDGADLTIRNTAGYALNPNVLNQSPGRFLRVDGFVRVMVENSYMEGTAGIYVANYVGDYTSAQTVKILRNRALNIDGRFSNGNGGFLSGPDDYSFAQFFQLNGVHDLTAAEVAWNEVINEPGRSRVEDNISIHDSSGTSASPLLIHDNYIRGAYPADPAHDTTYTGGGIMLSDNGSSYVRAYNNQVIGTSNYGIAISSGHDNALYGNRIISSGLLPDGKTAASQNVGAYIWNQNGELTFANNIGYSNVIGWISASRRNDWWVPDAAQWLNNASLPDPLTQSTEANEWATWIQKTSAAKVTVGLSLVP